MAFRFCVVTVASDGILAKYGTPFTPLNHYAPWNVDDDGRSAHGSTTPSTATTAPGSRCCIDGLFNAERFLQIVRDYVGLRQHRRRGW
jgi:type I restriction enzyme R subunit